MSTVMTWQTESSSSDETEQLAEALGRSLRGGETIELISDLGGGKTTFVRGLARGMGSGDKVSSPTFTISKVYDGSDKKQIHHFDFYRLEEPGIIADELAEVLGDPQIIVVVEWADIVHDVLPKERLSILIRQNPVGIREITFHYPETLTYLIEEVKECLS
jgi:tRNA threonylcarbamoyladenosine biosynthesis protein TsaE